MELVKGKGDGGGFFPPTQEPVLGIETPGMYKTL